MKPTRRTSAYAVQNRPARWLLIGGVFLAGLFTSACDPCDQLSAKICDCQPTETERRACRQDVDTQKRQRTVTDADRAVCAAKLETCTCAALDADDVVACGFSRDNGPSEEQP